MPKVSKQNNLLVLKPAAINGQEQCYWHRGCGFVPMVNKQNKQLVFSRSEEGQAESVQHPHQQKDVRKWGHWQAESHSQEETAPRLYKEMWRSVCQKPVSVFSRRNRMGEKGLWGSKYMGKMQCGWLFFILTGHIDTISDRTTSSTYISRKKWGKHKLS